MDNFHAFTHWSGPQVWFAYQMDSFKFFNSHKLKFPAFDWPNDFVHIKDLIGVELLIDNVPASKFKRAAVGTLVFGAVGTVAGLVSGATAKPRAKIHVVLQIDDIRVASFTTRCENIGTAYRLINTLALMEKKYFENNPNKLIEQRVEKEENADVSDKELYSEEIMKLKKLYDDGVIDQEEFKAFKKKLLENNKD